jgi:signal peptidase I
MPRVKTVIEPEPLVWEPAAPERSRRALSWLGELVQTLLVAGALFLAVNLATARIRVDGSSMEPTLSDGDLVVVNRIAHRVEALARGDIVVFHFPLDPGRRFIKRLIGLPGDQVSIHDGRVFVNQVPLSEPYIAAPPAYSGEWQVGPDEIFVLGDNRNNSSDSQNWGMVPAEEIVGKAVLVYWPLPSVGLIPHHALGVQAAQ